MARILVIDDEEPVLDLFSRLLKKAGHEVLLAHDRFQGIGLHQKAPADLVITDLFMNGQNELETLAQTRSSFPDIPIIIMSGYHLGSALIAQAQSQGATAFIPKPFASKQVLSAVASALKSDQGLAEN